MDHKSSILSHGNSFKLSICLIINFFLKYLSSLKVPSRNGDYFYLLVIRVSFSHLNRNRQDDNKVGMSAAICPLQRFVFFVILKLGVRDHCQQSMFYFMFDQMHDYVLHLIWRYRKKPTVISTKHKSFLTCSIDRSKNILLRFCLICTCLHL